MSFTSPIILVHGPQALAHNAADLSACKNTISNDLFQACLLFILLKSAYFVIDNH